MALTDTEIRCAKPARKAFKLYDREGLFALVNPTGSKLWRLKYKFQGKEKLMALGKYPTLKLVEARERAFAARKMLANGIDPMAAKKAEKNAALSQAEMEQRKATNSFKCVAEKWHQWWSKGVDAETGAYILRRLEADVFPVFGSMPIGEITAADIRNLILAIEKRGARDVAQRQHGTISQIFRYAVTHDLAERNPAADFKPSDVLSPRITQHRAHIDPSDLPALLVAIDDHDGEAVVHYALKLMTLLFVRTMELIEARWSEFDLDNARWVIKKERVKRKRRPHIVPLPLQAISILRELKQLAGNKEFLFPGLNKTTENGTINENSLLNALYDFGYKGVMSGHGFRSVARTVLAENGFEKAHVEIQLSHAKDDKVEDAYNHAQYLPQRGELMQWWADYVDSELTKGREKIAPIRHHAA
jgi:integrase